jgi:hypothetical protein
MKVAIERYWTVLVLSAAIGLWTVIFTQLALTRHDALGSHAEDLGFTDQVIWNSLHGRWFEMSVYQGATWNTELDVARLAHPESLLALGSPPYQPTGWRITFRDEHSQHLPSR